MGSKEQGADATHGRWVVIARTLCFVFNGDSVLLMRRASHKRVFPNRYNGLGGHIERDEDPLTCAVREIHEESGLQVHDVRLRGVYNIDTGEASGIVLFIFSAMSDTREVSNETDEGTLEWVRLEDALKLDLVEDLPHILPRVFTMENAAPPFFAHVSYDEHDHIVMRFVGE